MSDGASHPVPPRVVPDRDTQPFWDAVSERRLLVQRCTHCGLWIWQPKPVCPRCRADDPVWTPVGGGASLVSWTVVHPPVLPVWADAVPFVIVLVELDDAPGVRMVGQLVDASGARIQGDDGIGFGTPLALAWQVDEAGQTLPAWTVAG